MGLRAVANPLASGALPSNVTSASLNSITPSGGTLTVGGNSVFNGAINATGTITSSNAIETLNSGSLFQYNAGSTTYFGTRNNANNLDVSYNGGGVITRTNSSGFAVTGSISATAVSQFSGEAALDLPAAALFGGNSRVSVGYDTSNDKGVIGAVNTGVGWKTLALNPINGAVEVGPGGLRVFSSINTTSYIQGAEQTAPAAPGANEYRIFAQDNGAGKTQLMVIFASGAAQQIAIEP